MPLISRRDLGLIALATSPSAMAGVNSRGDSTSRSGNSERFASKSFDPADADFNLHAFTRILADHAGASCFHFQTGRILSVQDDRVGQPFLDFASVKQHRVRPLSDGSWQHGYRGVLLFCELDSGRVLESFANPLSGKTVSVEHFKTVMGSSIYGRDGAISLGRTEGGTMSAPGLHKRPFRLTWPAPLPTGDHLWTTYDERVELKGPDGRIQYADSSMYRYGLRRSELMDPCKTSIVDLTISWQTQTIWWPWMQMGSMPGHLLFGSMGRKYAALGQIPEDIVAASEQRFPGQISRPIDWKDYQLPDARLDPA